MTSERTAEAASSEEFPRDYVREAVLLSGEWVRLAEHEDKEVWKPEVADGLGPWEEVRLPGALLTSEAPGTLAECRFVWARRTFTLTEAQARRDMALKWGTVRHGLTAWLNGEKLGVHVPAGPGSFLVPRGLAKAGANELLLKVPGWAGVIRNEAGWPLIPTGSISPGGPPGVMDDVWIDFYDGVCLKHVLAVPDLDDNSVTFRIRLEGVEMPAECEVAATVRPWKSGTVSGEQTKSVKHAEGECSITVPVRDAKPWTPEAPNLYAADFEIRRGREIRDSVSIRFGMRELGIVGGHYRLNGRPIRFRGSNLVHEWGWGWNLMHGKSLDFLRTRDEAKKYLVDEARSMNLNCFRTHTRPPVTQWADIGDEHGTMFFAELPVLYNYRDYGFTEDDYKTWHENCLLDATGWVTKLWNHPSIVMWVTSNESNRDTEWESGPYRQHVRELDPTRHAFRSGGESDLDEIMDIHTCDNMCSWAEGRIAGHIRPFVETRGGRPLGNSEYMNWLGSRSGILTRLLGREDHPYAQFVQADFCMEHTELMRRFRFDLLLPYMYAGWTRARNLAGGRKLWRDDFPTPMAAALYSCMAPVALSVDLFDRNYAAGEEVAVPLHLVNEFERDVSADIDVYVTPHNPLFTESRTAIESAVSHLTLHDVEFKADDVCRTEFRFRVPEEEGVYHILLVLKRENVAPNVVSQREIRAIDPDVSQKGLVKKRLLVLGADDVAEKWLSRRGVDFATGLEAGAAGADAVLVWDFGKLSDAERAAAQMIRQHAKEGGRVVVLDEGEAGPRARDQRVRTLNWEGLLDLKVGWEHHSRAHPYPGVSHRLFADMMPEYFWRWNGVPGAVGSSCLEGPLPEKTRGILWIGKPERPIVVETEVGEGSILVSLLHLKGRVLKEQAAYDPVAERVLLNVLFGGADGATCRG